MLAIRYTVKYALFATLTIASIWIGNRLMSSHDEQLMIGPPQSPLPSVRWFDPSRAPDQVVTVTPPEQKAAPATPALRDMDPDDARDAAAVEDAKRNLCLPPPSERVRVWFQSIANNAGVCFSIYATYGACFEIRGSTLVLTNAFPVQGTQVDACAIGFCRPDRVPNKFFDYRDIIATTLDGKQVVVADHAQVSFFEADTKKHLHSLSYSMYPREIDILGIYAQDINFVVRGMPIVPYESFDSETRSFHGRSYNGKHEFVRRGSDDGNWEQFLSEQYQLITRDDFVEVVDDLAVGKRTIRQLAKPAVCNEKKWQAASAMASWSSVNEFAKQVGVVCASAIAAAQKKFFTPRGFVRNGERYQLETKNGYQLNASNAVTNQLDHSLTLPVCKSP
jgi:hypothetical protein